MGYLIFKYCVTAGIIVFVSETAKRNDKIGALITSLPIVTVLTLIWLHFEKSSSDKIGKYAYYTFWYILPTLPMFLIFPFLNTKIGFWAALLISTSFTMILFLIYNFILKRFGINII